MKLAWHPNWRRGETMETSKVTMAKVICIMSCKNTTRNLAIFNQITDERSDRVWTCSMQMHQLLIVNSFQYQEDIALPGTTQKVPANTPKSLRKNVSFCLTQSHLCVLLWFRRHHNFLVCDHYMDIFGYAKGEELLVVVVVHVPCRIIDRNQPFISW